MTAVDLLLVLAAGLAAGAVNAAAGGGTLVSYPALLALGLSPTAAVVTSGVGLLPGYAGAALGYRAEVRPLLHRLPRLLVWAAAGGAVGASLVLAVGDDAVEGVVPWLVLLACALLAVQPSLTSRLRRRGPPARSRGGDGRTSGPARAGGPLLGLAAVYGGFFGAALGVVLLALLVPLLAVGLQPANGAKAVVSLVVNVAGVAVFGLAALLGVAGGREALQWPSAAVLAAGALLGGVAGARLARRLPDALLRGVVVAGGVVVALVLLVG